MIIDLWKNPNRDEIVEWVTTLDRSTIMVRTNKYEIELLNEEDAIVFKLKFTELANL